jgi:hypothetical protein
LKGACHTKLLVENEIFKQTVSPHHSEQFPVKTGFK